ncbi:NfeD family protein [Calycomorphotria hydatis]|uniref:Uncharacterized protein n=1 Tax=Calycomorphotria hydatis TaxID=2528027 RepID=A0A517T413_9PLAN|nr:NfeD family protein [Calycomorphotria hydatis]QDT63099.1 hypothetical protein V22_02990 [Calycomorphotria hydatis]
MKICLNPTTRFDGGVSVRVLWALLLMLVLGSNSLFAQDDEGEAEAAEAKPEPSTVARVIVLKSPITEADEGRIRNVALELEQQARNGKRAVLVLEIPPGTSKFGDIRDLSLFLVSAQIAEVKTIAWIPESVDGNNAVLALACNEIVMHPDAEFGDLGRGQALSQADQQFVLGLVDGQHNSKVNRALVRGLSDPAISVSKARVGAGAEARARVVTDDDLRRLRNQSDAVITDVQVIIEPGVPGKFSGRRARNLDVLVTQTAETRSDIASIYDLPSDSLRPDPTAGGVPEVAFIKIEGVIEPILQEFVGRQIDRAVAKGANLIIFEIDSPGGLLLASQELAFRIMDLEEQDVRTVAYVPDQALSGAAIISLGCDEIYLHSGATIGDAGPIEITEGQQFERAPEKVLSFLRKVLRDLAERKGRPAAVAMAMADKDLKVYRVENAKTGREWFMTESEIQESAGEWIEKEVVEESREDNLLTIGGEKAHQLKIAEPPVQDLDELRLRLGVPLDVPLIPVQRTWLDTLVFVLNTPFAMAMLIALGIILIYIELHLMTGLLGILSALCFALFFWAKFLGGTADWLEVVLFVMGLACIAMEIFVIPGFGVFGVTGGLLLLASLVMASQTFGNIEPGTDFNAMARTIGVMGATLAVTIVLSVILNTYLPKLPFMSALILTPPGSDDVDPDEPQLDPSLRGPAEGMGALLGQTGTALTVLRPAGKAIINDDYYDVVSQGGYIDADTEIEVVAVEGNRVVVRVV